MTARVFVNRIWQRHFGRGLVGTPNDFGHLGEQPSHPELVHYVGAERMSVGARDVAILLHLVGLTLLREWRTALDLGSGVYGLTIADEETVLGSKVLVNPVVLLVGVNRVGDGSKVISLGCIGVRSAKVRQRPLGEGGDPVRRNRVVRKWLTRKGIDDRRAKPACQLFRAGNRYISAVALARDLLFVVREKECPVASVVQLRNPHGTAQRVTELVLIQRCYLGRVEEVSRVERAVAAEVESGAVQVVAAGLEADVDLVCSHLYPFRAPSHHRHVPGASV